MRLKTHLDQTHQRQSLTKRIKQNTLTFEFHFNRRQNLLKLKLTASQQLYSLHSLNTNIKWMKRQCNKIRFYADDTQLFTSQSHVHNQDNPAHPWTSPQLSVNHTHLFFETFKAQPCTHFQWCVLDWFLSAWFLDYYVVGLLTRRIYSVEFFLLGLLSAICESIS